MQQQPIRYKIIQFISLFQQILMFNKSRFSENIKIEDYQDQSDLPSFALNSNSEIITPYTKEILVNTDNFEVFSFSDEKINLDQESEEQPDQNNSQFSESIRQFQKKQNLLVQLHAIMNVKILNLLCLCFRKIKQYQKQQIVYNSIDFATIARQKIIPYFSHQINKLNESDFKKSSRRSEINFSPRSINISPKNKENKLIFRLGIKLKKIMNVLRMRWSFKLIKEYSIIIQKSAQSILQKKQKKQNYHFAFLKKSNNLQIRLIVKYSTKLIQKIVFTKLHTNLKNYKLLKIAQIYTNLKLAYKFQAFNFMKNLYKKTKSMKKLIRILRTRIQISNLKLEMVCFQKLKKMYGINLRQELDSYKLISSLLSILNKQKIKILFSTFYTLKQYNYNYEKKQKQNEIRQFFNNFNDIIDKKMKFTSYQTSLNQSTIFDIKDSETNKSIIQIGSGVHFNDLFTFQQPLVSNISNLNIEKISLPLKPINSDEILEKTIFNRTFKL